jgi:hypothetical protein
MLSDGYTVSSWSGHLPSAAVEAAWHSVLSGNSRYADVGVLAEFLGREWAYSAADPRAFTAFRLEQGIDDVRFARLEASTPKA